MKCSLCEQSGFSVAGLTFPNGNGVCFTCLHELSKFKTYAPNPYQDQPGNYFPKIGEAS